MTTIYKIRDWDKHFENNKSRERDACSWAKIPNKQDGLGYGRLIRRPDGPQLYGAFVAVVLVASKQKRPRDGHLTDTGLAHGRPYTADDLSIKTQMPAALIQTMLDAVSDASIGWIECYESSARRVPAECPPSAPSEQAEQRREEKAEQATVDALSLDSFEDMTECIISARPEFRVLSKMTIANALRNCPDHLRKSVVRDFVENTANMTESVKNPIGMLKAYIKRAAEKEGRDDKPWDYRPGEIFRRVRGETNVSGQPRLAQEEP